MQPAPGPLSAPSPWDDVAPAYAATIVPFLERYALEALTLGELEPGAHVLDVACGPGTLTIHAAQRARRVSAIDFSPQMVEQLRARLAAGNVRNVDAEVMDATALTFHDSSFDGVFCMFGAMFFPDRTRAFAEMRRVLRHGRRAVVATWSTLERRPLMQVIGQVMSELVPGGPMSEALPMETLADCEAELLTVGFRDVVAKSVSMSLRFESTDDYWEGFTAAAAPLFMLRKRLGEPAYAELAERAKARLRELRGDGPLELEAEALLTVGMR